MIIENRYILDEPTCFEYFVTIYIPLSKISSECLYQYQMKYGVNISTVNLFI